MEISEDAINRGIGVQLSSGQMADLLSRMQLQAEAVQGWQAVRVLVPPTRSDVLHACDVMEASFCLFALQLFRDVCSSLTTLVKQERCAACL